MEDLKALLNELNLYERNAGRKERKTDIIKEILLVFDNVDHMPVNVLNTFETRLVDMIRANENLRVMLSSIKKITFSSFQRADKPNNQKLGGNTRTNQL